LQAAQIEQCRARQRIDQQIEVSTVSVGAMEDRA